MNRTYLKFKALLFWSALFANCNTIAQTDTLRVLAYNILYLGDTPPCQGPHSVYEGYLETIVAYANPDIAGFDKMEAIPVFPGDNSGNAPAHFADSMLAYSMNAAYPGRYAYCPFTNTSGASNISLLFYNQQKLGYAGILCSYVNITDFTTYKLYYKSPDLSITHDTIFLYVTLNHTNSGTGSGNEATRQSQIGGEMGQIETHFTTLPNMINMGDFNTHHSTEACYQTLVSPSNPNYRFYDPPFYPDATYVYPADWDSNPNSYASCLTTSTRSSGSLPNSCSGSSGGGKSWYDHIFLSANIINNANYISYIPHSFRVIGNDGNRVGVSANAGSNTSAPAAVVNDIYQMSEHYPTAVELLVTIPSASVASAQEDVGTITVANPVKEELNIRVPGSLAGKTINMICTDMLGRTQMKKTFMSCEGTVQFPCRIESGIYYLYFTTGDRVVGKMTITKK